MTVLKLTAAGIKMSWGSNEQRAELDKRLWGCLLACYEDTEGDEETVISPDCSAWFLQVRILASPPVLLGVEDDDPADPHAVQEEVPLS
jgi:hypothetical protein